MLKKVSICFIVILLVGGSIAMAENTVINVDLPVTEDEGRLFNFAPIAFEFSKEPSEVEVKIKPNIKGEIIVEGKKVKFKPEEKYEPDTEYKIKVSSDNKICYEKKLISINEMKQHVYEDFSDQSAGLFPEGWSSRADGEHVFQVQKKEGAGKVLAGIGVETYSHAHANLPSFTLESSDSLLLFETTVWYDADVRSALYLFEGGEIWPPYIGLRDDLFIRGKMDVPEDENGPFEVTYIFDPKSKKDIVDIYVDYEYFCTIGEETEDLKAKGWRNVPPENQKNYMFGVYIYSKGTSNVYWDDMRVAEIKR